MNVTRYNLRPSFVFAFATTLEDRTTSAVPLPDKLGTLDSVVPESIVLLLVLSLVQLNTNVAQSVSNEKLPTNVPSVSSLL